MKPLTIGITPCESSRIFGHGYDQASRVLALQFKRKNPEGGDPLPGTVYHYAGVEPETYAELCCAESVGKFFGERINAKDDEGNLRYPFTKIEAEEPAA